MNPFSLITQPISDVTRAVFMPFKALFVVGLCGLINYMTFNGHWWVQWVALGMGIAVLVAFARAAKSLLLLALVAWVGSKIYRRYGGEARAQFDAWVARTRPQAAEVVEAWHRGAAPAAADAAALRH